MAVTKIWPVRGRVEAPLNYAANEMKTENPRWDKDSLQNLTDVMHYAADYDKTEKQFFVSGINCSPELARDEFVMVKRQFDKEDGIVAYHGYQSFAEGEVTPELAHSIGLELASRYWGEDYQVVVATHLNTNHIHNHFVVNSVSFRTGLRCQSKTWYDFNRVSDEICREYGLSIVDNPHGRGIPAHIYKAECEGAPTRLNLARDAVDEALKVSQNLTEFRKVLFSNGYICNLDPGRNYWTIRQKDWKRPIRMYRMGQDYSNRRLLERLSDSNGEKDFRTFQVAVVVKGRQYRLPTRAAKARRYGSIRGLYLHYCYLLGFIPKYCRANKKVSPLLRDDLLKLDQITEETRFICREGLVDSDDLVELKAALSERKAELQIRQADLRRLIKRKVPDNVRENARNELVQVNSELKDARHKMKLVERIEERSKTIEEKVTTIDKQQERSVMNHESRW